MHVQKVKVVVVVELSAHGWDMPCHWGKAGEFWQWWLRRARHKSLHKRMDPHLSGKGIDR